MRSSNAGVIAKGTKRIMRSFKLCEISAVDVPAQEGAVMTLMKRNDSAPQTVNQHKQESAPMQIDINSPEFKDALAKAVAPVQASLDKVTADFAKAKKEWEDAEEEAKDKEEEDEAEKARKAADEVIYKATDGTEFRKSQGQALADMAKRADVAEASIAKAKEDQENAEIAKAVASEMDKLPGDEALKVSVYKALKPIAGAMEMLKAANEANKGAFETAGTTGGKDVVVEATNKAEANTKLDEMAKKVQAEKKITYAKAYDEVLKSPDGKKLYELTIKS